MLNSFMAFKVFFRKVWMIIHGTNDVLQCLQPIQRLKPTDGMNSVLHTHTHPSRQFRDVMSFVEKMTFRMSQSFRTLKHRFTWRWLANFSPAEVSVWNILCVLFQKFLAAFSWLHRLAHFKVLTLHRFSNKLSLEQDTRPTEKKGISTMEINSSAL